MKSDTASELTKPGGEPLRPSSDVSERLPGIPQICHSVKTKTFILALSLGAAICIAQSSSSQIGREVGLPRHLQNGEEYRLSISQLIEQGRKIFTAVWSDQEGGGRPFSKGTGAPLSDPSQPLLLPRNFNRVSGPDANSCAACHAQPFGIVGGHGDIVANVFVLGQRFDFGTFDRLDSLPTKGSVDELGRPVTLQSIANSRVTIGMFGSGFIEMLARQITHDLQTIRDTVAPGHSHALLSKGTSYGTIARCAHGTWDTSQVEGIPAQSLASPDAEHPPSLIIRPFHQAANRVSLRDFSNTAFNQHHGIQSTERFGVNIDADGDGFANELTRADMTAVTIFQATMAVPGRVIPDNAEIETAVLNGERKFQAIGCASCHVPALALDNQGWIFTEPNPYNPAGNLRVGGAPTLSVDLTDHTLPPPAAPSTAQPGRPQRAGLHRSEASRYLRRAGRPEHRNARHEPAGRFAGFLRRQQEVHHQEALGRR
jgi:hypothetical protein